MEALVAALIAAIAMLAAQIPKLGQLISMSLQLRIDALEKAHNSNAVIIEVNSERLDKLENGGTTTRIDTRLAEHGLIDRRGETKT